MERWQPKSQTFARYLRLWSLTAGAGLPRGLLPSPTYQNDLSHLLASLMAARSLPTPETFAEATSGLLAQLRDAHYRADATPEQQIAWTEAAQWLHAANAAAATDLRRK